MRTPSRSLIALLLPLTYAASNAGALDAAVAAQTTNTPDPARRPIRFARHPSLSPDGKILAFSYQGDIWTVPAEGGTATRLTLHEAHDQTPSWSPDGKSLAFSSNRDGNYDIWVMSAAGGRPRQITFHSADDLLNGWSPDGREILFSSSRETTQYPALYAITEQTSTTRLIAESEMPLGHASFSPDGKSVAATHGGSWTRKNYRGSANSDLLLLPAQGTTPGTWLVKREENERWPLFAPDSKTFYFVSDKGGPTNVWRGSLGRTKTEQVTSFTDGTLYFPTLARTGDRIICERNFGLWSIPLNGSTPTEIQVFAPSDDRSNTLRREAFTTGVQEAELAPDGRSVALVIHGEIFLQPLTGGDTVRLTNTPHREEDIIWSPDSRSLAFSSDREGNQDLYVLDVRSKKVRPVTRTPGQAENAPQFSPDGKSLLFARGFNQSELCVVPFSAEPTGTEAVVEPRVLVRDPSIDRARWSPDGKWVAYSRMKSHSAGAMADIFLVNVAEPKPVNITRYPGLNLAPTWSSDGKTLFFISDRSGDTNLWSISLQDDSDPEAAAAGGRRNGRRGGDPGGAPVGTPAPATPAPTTPAPANSSPSTAQAGAQGTTGGQAAPATAKPVEVVVEVEDIHKRAKQVTRGDARLFTYAVSPDSKSIVFPMVTQGRPDLWRIAATGGTPARITQTGTESGGALQFSSDGNRLMYVAGGGVRLLALNSPAPTPTPVPFRARMDIDIREELTQMFDEAWRKMRDSFYDEKMHGVDWNAVRERYRPVLSDITYKQDFYTLFTLALGELNSSHIGISGDREETGGPSTPSLGVVFDDAYAGPGVKVKWVMPKGPADKESSRLRPGDILLRIDSEEIKSSERLCPMLNEKTGKQVELLVNSEPKEEGARTVKLRPISQAAYKALEYDRWVREREQLVDKLSGGRFAYVHLSSMDPPNLEKFRRMVFGDAQEKEGLVIDVRFNGGGNIADEMMAILQDKVFGYRTLRGDGARLPSPLMVFTRPTTVLINHASFSNAEVFPWGYKELKLGKVVGVPTYGAVIGVGSTNLIDGSTLRTPMIGSYTLAGENMENRGCPPDIYVEHTPEDIYMKSDRQLQRSVEELLKSAGKK